MNPLICIFLNFYYDNCKKATFCNMETITQGGILHLLTQNQNIKLINSASYKVHFIGWLPRILGILIEQGQKISQMINISSFSYILLYYIKIISILFLIVEFGNPSLFPEFVLKTPSQEFQIVLIDSKFCIFLFCFYIVFFLRIYGKIQGFVPIIN